MNKTRSYNDIFFFFYTLKNQSFEPLMAILLTFYARIGLRARVPTIPRGSADVITKNVR